MFDVGLLYSITAGVACIVVLIMYFRTMATDFEELIDKPFLKLTNFVVIFCLIDAIWGLLTSSVTGNHRIAYIIFSYLFHFGSACSAYVWAEYVINYIGVEGRKKTVLNFARGILLMFQSAVLSSNIWTGAFFVVDAEGNYITYQLRNFMFALQFAYYIIIIVYSFVTYVINRKSDKGKIYLKTLIFSSVPLIFGFAQMLWPDGPMYSLGFMLCTVLIYSINITDQREDLIAKIYKEENNKLTSIVSGLSEDYVGLYYIDMNTNRYERYTNIGNMKDGFDVMIAENFFEDKNMAVEDDVHPDDRVLVKEMISKAKMQSELTDKTTYTFNYRLKSGKRNYKYYMTKVIKPHETGDSNHVILGVFDDDARTRAVMDKQRAMKDAAKTAERANEAKTNFLFNMSHDIRTPMNAILGFTEIAKKHIDDKEYLTEVLDKVLLASNHLMALINDILDMSRIESGRFDLDIKTESIRNLGAGLCVIADELATSRDIKFTYEVLDVTQEYVKCDRLHLNQVLLNILSNAMKYTDIGGNVKFTIRQLGEKYGKVTYEFVVEDDGIGMSREFLSKIYDQFERESTVSASGIEGTGLGMSIVKKLVDKMSGSININSKKGEGTTVIINISFEVSMAPIEKSDENVYVDVKVLEGKRILLVDDNELNREIAADLLAEYNVIVEEAEDGAMAVKMVEEAEECYYDAVLMDIQMPVMDGYDATRSIRAIGKRWTAALPIIAMTANAFDEDRRDAALAGMNAHLAKPVRADILAETLVMNIGK